jgi:hypothetical protein
MNEVGPDGPSLPTIIKSCTELLADEDPEVSTRVAVSARLRKWNAINRLIQRLT